MYNACAYSSCLLSAFLHYLHLLFPGIAEPYIIAHNKKWTAMFVLSVIQDMHIYSSFSMHVWITFHQLTGENFMSVVLLEI